MAEIEAVIENASSRIFEARSELQSLLPDHGRIDDFGPAHASVLFANAAANLKAVELLIADGLTSSAAVVLRTFIFGAIRLAWFAAAETSEELEARVVAFQKSSLDYEIGLLHRAKKSGGDLKRIEEFSRCVEAELKEVQDWKSEVGAGKRLTDEIMIAGKLGDMGGLITVVALLDQYVHVNRAATNAAVNPDPEKEQALEIGDRPQAFLVHAMLTASMQALAIASVSFLEVIETDPEIIEQVRSAGQRWVEKATSSAKAAES